MGPPCVHAVGPPSRPFFLVFGLVRGVRWPSPPPLLLRSLVPAPDCRAPPLAYGRACMVWPGVVRGPGTGEPWAIPAPATPRALSRGFAIPCSYPAHPSPVQMFCTSFSASIRQTRLLVYRFRRDRWRAWGRGARAAPVQSGSGAGGAGRWWRAGPGRGRGHPLPWYPSGLSLGCDSLILKSGSRSPLICPQLC